MKLNTQLSPTTAFIAILAVFIPFAANLHVPLLHGHTVSWIENGQAVLLFLGAIFTISYMKPFTLSEGACKFWLWSALWWVVLLGRSTSWGRDYFPDLPKMVFKSIAVILIAALVLSLLLSSQLRKEIMARLNSFSLPVWTCALVVSTFFLADTVEHHRLLAPVFLHDPKYQDLIEELFETPFIIGLFLVSFDFMQQEKHYEEVVDESSLVLL